MSMAELRRFEADLARDQDLRQAVKRQGLDPEAVAGLARGQGYDFSAAELDQHPAGKTGELSEEELEQVTGGVGGQADLWPLLRMMT